MPHLEGAKTTVRNYKTTAGTPATIIQHMLTIACYTEAETRRLRLDPTLTSDRTMEAEPGIKKILIYDATPHPLLDLILAKCGPWTTPRDKQLWATHMLKHVEQLPYV